MDPAFEAVICQSHFEMLDGTPYFEQRRHEIKFDGYRVIARKEQTVKARPVVIVPAPNCP